MILEVFHMPSARSGTVEESVYSMDMVEVTWNITGHKSKVDGSELIVTGTQGIEPRPPG